ncbi:hypothetical protein [Cupriavidus sp. L7L]|uniref:hypothetical protein n=1 Tax=Cupriavidus sp. L7L TaxID=2546443 RepID=UPI001FB63CC9|nr:hypothetical protein [Cupriavidus sp. L7L]
MQIAAMRSPTKSFRERSIAFFKLQNEVRETTERVHGHAIKRASNGDASYLAHVAVLIDALIDRSDARGRVICFASAAEFGLSLHHHGERCRQAAMLTGSDSIMVLYWAAVRRMHGHGSSVAKNAEMSEPLSGSRPANTAPAVNGNGEADTTWLHSERSSLCEKLHGDSRCANGHNALRPISGKHFRSVGESLISEAQVFQCSECEAIWTQYRHRSDPFAMWSIKNRR